MPYRTESMLMSKDAPADASTELGFNPPNGPFDGASDESKVEGTLTSKYDVDWIALEMSAGKEYTISLAGSEMLTDTKVRLLDSKGDEIMALDDVDMDGDGKADSLHPTIKYTPEAGTCTQKYHIEVSAYTGNPGTNDIMEPAVWTLTADEMVLPDPTTGEILTGDERGEAAPDAQPPVVAVLGDDKIKGTANNDTISGLSGDDSLYGMAGDDELNGGDDDDLLSGGPGADELNGGDGEDTIDYSYSPMGVTINLGDGTARGGDAVGDTIGDDIENVRGSMHDDALTGARVGTARHNKLWGLCGNDELDGLRRRDELYGGAGADNLDGGGDNDMLEGGYGADVLIGGDDMDTASYMHSMMGVTVRLHNGQAMGGDAEGDTWNLSETVEYLDSDEEMAITTVADIENLTGSGNDDILAGDLRNNTIKGGGGDDKIYGGPNPVDADEGSDAMLTNADMLYGGGIGDDMLKGDGCDDMLHGGPGDDMFYGGTGSDMIYADTDDTMIVGDVAVDDDGTAAVDESGAMEGDVDTVSFARVEDETIGTDAANRWTLGEASSNAYGIENVIGTQGDDFIAGDAGDNVIEGGEGADNMDGGGPAPTAGAVPAGMIGDTLSYESSDDWVRVTLNDDAAATASRGHASGDTATNFENIGGSAHDDDLGGNGSDNHLWGLAGDDEIEGGGGNDTIEGGAGADELDGGYDDSNTTADGNQANSEMNTLSYAGSDAGVTVNLVTASVSGGHAEGDTIVTFERLVPTDDNENNEVDVATFANVTGLHDDRLTGDNNGNHLVGGAGDDVLRAGAGMDLVIGGPGADMLDGGEDSMERNNMVPNPSFMDDQPVSDTNTEMVPASIDWAVYKHSMDAVTVDLSTNMGTAGEAMGDTLRNIELIWGSENGNTFIMSAGRDIIEGDGVVNGN